MKKIHINAVGGGYDIIMEKGAAKKADEYCNLNCKVLIITDDGVPKEYAEDVANKSKEPVIVTLAQGEGAKSIENFTKLLAVMLENGFTRNDCVVAVGGGVIGDLAGFVAASYMRGVAFYNIPTTTLSQVDSSIGGKVAIDFNGVKNVVGAFYMPKAVIIDIEVLKTQTERQFVNGFAEAIKAGLIYDENLFEIFEKGNAYDEIEKVILLSLNVKKQVVEQDEKETGIRKILNFGHTLGHGVESAVGLGELLHGECVGIGMLLITDNEEIKNRIKSTLIKYSLPTTANYDKEKAYEAVCHDKKANGENTTVIKVNKIGSAVEQIVKTKSLKDLL